MDWITSDLIFFNGQSYIIVRNIVSTMTFFNRCAEDSDSIIQFFHSFQLWYGWASKIWLDGGHCYKSTAFSKYCQDNRIKHEFSVPYHPAAIIESPVLRAKFCLRCGTNMKVDPQLILSSYQDLYLSDCHASPKEILLYWRLKPVSPLFSLSSNTFDWQALIQSCEDVWHKHQVWGQQKPLTRDYLPGEYVVVQSPTTKLWDSTGKIISSTNSKLLSEKNCAIHKNTSGWKTAQLTNVASAPVAASSYPCHSLPSRIISPGKQTKQINKCTIISFKDVPDTPF